MPLGSKIEEVLLKAILKVNFFGTNSFNSSRVDPSKNLEFNNCPRDLDPLKSSNGTLIAKVSAFT